MSFPSITNRGEFFSNHYLDAIIGGDLGDLRAAWDEGELRGDSARSRLKGLGAKFFAARADAAEATSGNCASAISALNGTVLSALGFEPNRQTIDLKRNTTDLVEVPVASLVDTSTGLLLVALDAGLADAVDDLFDDAAEGPHLLLDPLHRSADKKFVRSATDAVGEVFATDEPPRYVLVVAGRIVLLAERAKWAEGRFLAVDLDEALERNDTRAKGELETIAALFSADALVPGGIGGEGAQSVLDDLVDKSHKHAVGVSKELRTGIRESIEILANEVIVQLDNDARAGKKKLFTRGEVDATELTRQCLRYLYRLLVLLYAESRPELGILPVNDQAYMEGYSLDRLRELVLVDLDTDAARNGSHLDESLTRLFELTNEGYHAEHAEQMLALDWYDTDAPTREEYLQFPGLDAALFDPKSTAYLDAVTLRNESLQLVLRKLMLAQGRRAKDSAGFISYAQLGINQLGAVYEGLMAYTGFFADTDLYEVAKGGDPSGGTWMLPVDDADGYPDEVFVTRTDSISGRTERVLHRQGGFVFRLSGRDRQRSASYYTPEVLTRCVVKHALAELLGTDDYAPDHGSSGIRPGEATKILDLTICEPALGSGAFANEAINQVAAEYLKRRQAELGETLDPERYLRELQKVKAHFALHQTYGVDLNGTAVELAEVSLWLNAMYPGLKAPWFGLQLRQGNSLIGCRRATWRTSQLGDRVWAKTKKAEVQPPVDRKLSDGALDDDEIHHFLLPGHGWAAVADRKEAKELRPDEVAALKEWKKKVLAGPKKTDAKRLAALAAGVETMWRGATERIRMAQAALRRPIDVYGATVADGPASVTRAEAERVLRDPDSPLGRLRTLMDAWVGMWFWPLDTGVTPPTWDQWLQVAEELVRPDERHGPSGQLDLFADLDQLIEAQERLALGQTSVADLRVRYPWLAVAVDAARREGAWHWDLEFAPVFAAGGGFDLQVGNPPWVRPTWQDNLVLAEIDPWWGITDKPPTREENARRLANLGKSAAQRSYLIELAAAEGVAETLGSPVGRPVLAGVQTNLYMVFMDTVWRHLASSGTAGLIHPESHFHDPSGASLRGSAYVHLRRHWQFLNGLFLFEEVNDKTVFGIHVYARPEDLRFEQSSYLFHPDMIDASLAHSGEGPGPGIQYQGGGWDLRPHRSRITTITKDVLADWARLFDEPGTPPDMARLLRPVTTADLEALSVLADQPVRLGDHGYHWTAGWHEKGAKDRGIIEWRTEVPSSWDEVILQGPHFTIATPFAKQPNDHCKHNQDYSDWDLESLPEQIIPRSNYQRSCDVDTYRANLDNWNGQPATSAWRLAWRAMTQPGLERSLHSALLPPGPAHVGGVFSLSLESSHQTVSAAGLWSTLPLDYLVKVSGVANVKEFLVKKFPTAGSTPWLGPLQSRTLRLNCLTGDYAPLWAELWDPAWRRDRWTDTDFDRAALGDVGPQWSMATPLRRDFERRLALVELDALAALMLGLTAEQLCAMYRTQFAVLRKYEYKMAFDAEGRKLCGYHQSAGYRQGQLQERAKAGDLPQEWKNIWSLYEQYEDDPGSVDWLGLYSPPFTRPDRELEMTRAYNEFQHRLEAGEYDT